MSQGGILNVTSIPSVPTSFSTDAGTAIPVANLLQILGGEGIDTSAVGNIVTITGELATAAANIGLANLGICAFSSADFTVVNGFVTIAATFDGGLSWTAIGASQTLVINNGYICTAGGALALALPALSAVGTVIAIALDGSGSFSITQAAGQQVRLGSITSTLGAGGSITTTAQGDSLMMVCKVANTLWTIYDVLGNFTVV